MSLSPEALRILAQTVMGEARGEGYDGMRAVAHVIRNRSLSGRYPSDPVSVALQRAQFSAWNEGLGGNNPGRFGPGTPGYQDAVRAVQSAFSGQDPDPTGGATHYWSPSGMMAESGRSEPSWANGEQTEHGRIQIGRHVFLPRSPVSNTGDGLTAIASATGLNGLPPQRPGTASAYAPTGNLDASPARAAVNPGPGPQRPSWMIPPPSPPQRPAGLTGPGRAEVEGSRLPMPRPPVDIPLPMPRPGGNAQLRNVPLPMPRPGDLPTTGQQADPQAAAMDSLRAALQIPFPQSIASGVSGAVLPAYQTPPPIVANAMPGEGDGLPPALPPAMPGTPMGRGGRAGNMAIAAQEATAAPGQAPNWSEMFAPFQQQQTAMATMGTGPVNPGAGPPRPPMGMGGPAAMPPGLPPQMTVAGAQTPQNPLQMVGNAIGERVQGAMGFLTDPVGSMQGTYNERTGRMDRQLPGLLGMIDRGGPRPTMFTPDPTDTWSTPVTAVGNNFNQMGWLSSPDGVRNRPRMDNRDQSQVNTYRANRDMVRNVLGEDTPLNARTLNEAIARGGTGFVRDEEPRMNSRRGRRRSGLRRS